LFVEVKIGVRGAPRELMLETDEAADDITAAVRAAAADPTSLLELTDTRGRRVLVPADKLAYVELGEQESRKVGFAAM
jgi:hypothetical protein